MGSAVSNLVGGGGGSILGTIGGAIGMEFGPLGSMVGAALGNLIQSAVVDGIKDGIKNLQQEHGMPNFLANALMQVVDKVGGGMQNPNVDAGLQAALGEKNSGALRAVRDGVSNMFTGNVLQVRKDEDSGTGTGGWLQAIAKAMGKALGDKAAHMVDLSTSMQSHVGAKAGSADANQFNKDMTDFQATGQEYSMLNSVFSTAIKSIGEAMSSMARKQ